MKQIISLNDLIGKTISKVLLSEPELWVKFTDNSFAVFDVEDRTEGFGHTKSATVLSDWGKDATSMELVSLDLITLSEHENAVREEENKWELNRKEEEQKQQSEIEKLEREQYEKLSKKYGK